MAGIYIHIPFCKQACNYCNFHFSTSLKQKDALLHALQLELQQRKSYLQEQVVETVYFGGGTPSLLSAEEIMEIWEVIAQHYTLATQLEVTLEANPDDLTAAYLKSLSTTPINRFSIGIQSFFDADLQFMNRAHNATEAINCIKAAQDAGFRNLTVDLIYGTPTTSHDIWLKNLETVFDLQIPHFSSYALTVEPKTALEYQIRKGKAQPVDDHHTAEQFELLLEQITQHGYEQYEISNFCRPPHYAKHNSNYWKGKHYLGVGPSAHSFNGHSRQWNIAHNPQYIKLVPQQATYWEVEQLSFVNQYNEYIMTALRTKWGVQLEQLKKWGDKTEKTFLQEAAYFLQKGLMEKQADTYVLTAQGKLIANTIMADLFMED